MSPAPIRRVARLRWGRVSYLDWGAAAPDAGVVLLLHGGGADGAELSWGGIAPALAAAGHRVIAPDHPGFGQSPPPPWVTTQDRLVRYVGEFTDALALDRYAVAGLSLGGGMAIGHALARSGPIDRVILLGSYGIMARLSDGPLSLPRQLLTWSMVRTGILAPLTRWLARQPAALDASLRTLIRDPDRRTPELLAAVRAAARAGHGDREFAQWQRDQIRWNRLATDYTPRLPSMRCPALIIHGDRDTGVPVAHARTAARLLPHARLVILPGAGHWVQRDRPEAVLAAMTEFLAAPGS